MAHQFQLEAALNTSKLLLEVEQDVFEVVDHLGIQHCEVRGAHN
jgi:hypothetical protein